ncbi:leucine-rich repeat receptor protein kinase HPCA1-like isoform X1 [Apium graveolens]|uniref:leucine-rich repeat receptor protein kinase HPCA1-like isoform X1 n=2 Tax=Apium graveolens TaxID=4045 RepID=UPI003D79EBF3
MDERSLLLVFVLNISILIIAAQQINQDYAVLRSLKDVWENLPPSWDGTNPCQENWEGVGCTNSRVTSITLASMNLTGTLSGDIPVLSELLYLDLSYNKGLTGPLLPSIGNFKKLKNLILVGCSFSGIIPDTIGNLQYMRILSLNSNAFSGQIPPSIGNLSNLYWLDLSDNRLTGNIPVSTRTTPGLDLLVNTKHFHFGKNQLSGEIPSKLFSSRMTLLHVLFENNQLTGEIPSTIGLVQSLEVLRLDRNLFSGYVPENLNNLTHVNELFLSNNRLSGPLPNLAGMNFLFYVDMSNNSFDVSDFSLQFTTLRSLTTIVMENTSMQGPVPPALFSIPQLQTVKLRNNNLNGTIDIGSSFSNQLRLVDLQNNNISAPVQRAGDNSDIILIGNPYCESGGTGKYCVLPQQSNSSLYSTKTNNCVPALCGSDQISSPNCICAYPYQGHLYFKAPSFSNLEDPSIYTSLQLSLMSFFQSTRLPVDSVSLSNPTKNLDDYLVIRMEVFPFGQDRFNRTGISSIGFVFSNQTFKPDKTVYGTYYFIGDNYGQFSSDVIGRTSKSSSTGIFIGAAAGGCVLVLLLLLAGIYAFRQNKRAKRATQLNAPFASWDSNSSSTGGPQLKGARSFSYEDLKKCTNNFAEVNAIGSGGYGKVYRGSLTNGMLVAIKRADQESMQGGHEFKTEIELLSRVHHKNVVSLMGFCFELGEQMLVYEYIANGTLKESLSGKSGIRLDWNRRLRIALGAAKGLQYLHDLANPPIIHRDIKSNNILLDEHLNAKVADFGLSKPMANRSRGHVTTQVKGTMGYLDPEYYMTQKLTEKSDVYSFGVVMLEMITARRPIENGKYIVREVKLAMDKTKSLYNLQGFLDPAFDLITTLKGLEKFVDLALRCVDETGDQRPPMSDVVKEIENIMSLAGFDPKADLASSSSGYDGWSRGYEHPYSDKSLSIFSRTHKY